MRQIVLDTETTGLSPEDGHRIIEIGCVELINRRLTGNHYHQYIQPQREVESDALAVHGISDEFLKDKPIFEQISKEFLEYIGGSELIIHNAPFDVGFLNSELARLNLDLIASRCTVFDTLVYARKKHPGQQNSLDALCRRYGVNLSKRDLHGALLDSELLASVYLAMTSGQTSLFGEDDSVEIGQTKASITKENKTSHNMQGFKIIRAQSKEVQQHKAQLQHIQSVSESGCVWLDKL